MRNEDVAIKVANMSASGISNEDIAFYFNIEQSELEQLYNNELRTARIDRIVRVSEILYSSILEDGHAASAMFYLKNIGRWEDIAKTEKPVKVDNEIKTITVRIPTKEEIDAKVKERLGDDE